MIEQQGGNRERESEGSARRGKGDSTSDGWQRVCKGREQESGLLQTQHPAADISSLAAAVTVQYGNSCLSLDQ